MITRVPATSSTKVRSEILMAAIEEKYPGRTVNLIAHSMVSFGDVTLFDVLTNNPMSGRNRRKIHDLQAQAYKV
jgi:hypothetical protein